MLTVAAGLSVQSIFSSGRQLLGLDESGDSTLSSDLASHDNERLISEEGDLITLLLVYEEWRQVKQKESHQSKKWCRRRGIEEQRLYDIAKLRSQFYQVLVEQQLIDMDARPEDKEDKLSPASDHKRELSKLRKRSMFEGFSGSSSKRRVLKMDGGSDAIFDMDGDQNDGDEIHSRIRDLEFRLAQVRGDIGAASSYGTKEIIRRKIQELKIILAAGLYPQIAVPDEANSVKTDAATGGDLAFHTRNKNFLLIHPSSIFFKKPAFLQTPGRKTTLKGRHLMSDSHQLIAFTQLLETNKPYVVNCLKIPAVQTLLLCSTAIDTSVDFSKLLFDSWLEVTFSKPSDGDALVRMAVQLRSAWDKLLNSKLKHLQRSGENDEEKEKGRNTDEMEEIFQLERELPSMLADFLRIKAVYSFRRVFTAELRHLYLNKNENDHEIDDRVEEGHSHTDDFMMTFNPSGEMVVKDNELKPHPTKGGQMISSYLVFNR